MRIPLQIYFCGVSGALAGLLAWLLIGQAVFLWVGGEWLGRGLGWIVLSLLIGLGQSAGDASIRRCLVGSVGGFVAGLFSGLVYEGLTQVFLSYSGTAQVWASSIGLMAVGGLLAAGIPLAETLAARGVLVVLSGQRNGAEYPILDRLLVGASESCRVLIPDDPDLEPEQLALQARAGGIQIANVGRSRAVLVNGGNLPPGNATSCPSGTMIRAGKTELRVL